MVFEEFQGEILCGDNLSVCLDTRNVSKDVSLTLIIFHILNTVE